MGLPVITYAELSQIVLNYMLNNTMNVDSKYNSLPACFRPGYFIQNTYGKDDFFSYIKISINKAIQRVSSSRITSDFNNFLNTYKMSAVANIAIQETWYPLYIGNLVSFVSTKGAFAISQFDTRKFFIYNTAKSTYLNAKVIGNTPGLDIVSENDINDVLKLLTESVNQTFRLIPCTYTCSIW